MDKEKKNTHKEIQAQVLRIVQGDDLIAKILLFAGGLATVVALIWLVIKALWWVIIFMAGVVLLSAAMRKGG